MNNKFKVFMYSITRLFMIIANRQHGKRSQLLSPEGNLFMKYNFINANLNTNDVIWYYAMLPKEPKTW